MDGEMMRAQGAPEERSLRRRHAGGRPTKLTEDNVAKMLSAIRCGAPKSTAAKAVGIAPRTLRMWLQRAKEPDAPPELRDLKERLDRAREEGITARLATIQKASQEDWRAAAWLLERDDPEKFSMRQKVEHSGSIGLAHLLGKLADEKRDEGALDEGAPDEGGGGEGGAD